MDLRLRSAILAAMVATAATPAGAATVLNVGWNSGCGKSTCFNDNGVFTRTWSAKDTAGPVTIGSLLLDRSVLGNLDGQTFRISFSLNGETLGTWGRYNVAGFGGDQFGFSGGDVVWNPEDGDLVLTLELDPAPKAGGLSGGGFSFRADPPPRDDLSEPQPPAFSDAAFEAAAVPEPGAWALMILGFGMAGAAMRGRRRLTA
jgi:hypothetical protein